MEQNHEFPSSFQETERCFYVCSSGRGSIAFRHRSSPNALFSAYFLFYQYDAKLLTVPLDGGEYHGSRCTRISRCIPVNAQTQGDKVTGRARLTGEFPGSPVERDHIFELSNDKMASPEIRS